MKFGELNQVLLCFSGNKEGLMPRWSPGSQIFKNEVVPGGERPSWLRPRSQELTLVGCDITGGVVYELKVQQY